jgi:hypothetical protein
MQLYTHPAAGTIFSANTALSPRSPRTLNLSSKKLLSKPSAKPMKIGWKIKIWTN